MTDPKYTAKRAAFVFACPMNPCPKCGGYHLMYQTPIKMDEPILPTDTAKSLLGKWARAMKDDLGESAPMEGAVFIMCFDCGHKGASVDCTGMTRGEVGRSKVVADEVKRLWNAQEKMATP